MRAAAGVAAAGGYDLALFQKSVRDRDRLSQQATRVVTQVEHHALQRVTLFAKEIVDCLNKAGRGLFGECGHPHIADAVENFRANRADLDEIADDGYVERLKLATLDLDGDLRADLAAKLLDSLRQLHADDRDIVNRDQIVFWLEPGAGCWRVIDRRHDLDHALIHRDLDAKAAEPALGLFLHFGEIFGVEECRMWVKRGQHACDGRFDQLAIIDFIDIAFAHALEDVTKQAKLAVHVFLRRGLRRGKCWSHHARHKDGSAENSHMPRAKAAYTGPVFHISSSLRRDHAVGLM